jgi:hypothetical protein
MKAEIDSCLLIIFLDPPVDTESPSEDSVLVSFAVDHPPRAIVPGCPLHENGTEDTNDVRIQPKVDQPAHLPG